MMGPCPSPSYPYCNIHFLARILMPHLLLCWSIEKVSVGAFAFMPSSPSRSGRIGGSRWPSPYLNVFNSCECTSRGVDFRMSTCTPMHLAATDTDTDSKYEIEELSKDPKCFLVHNFLSKEECAKYIARADATEPELMTQSNAPEVSLQMERLWPLPFLCLGAGIPPIIRLLERESETESNIQIHLEDIVSTVLPPIAIALGVTAALIFAITNLVTIYAQTSSRTSVSLALNTEEDCDFIRTLVDRASDVTNHPWSQWEAPVITKYPTDAVFASHNDASPTKGSEWAALGGQRVVTVITYLNTCDEGGGTKFDQLGFTVQPREGSALIFYPADGETLEADGRTVHQSLPAVDEKYIVQLFGRHERVPSPLGIPASYSIE